MPVNYLPVFCYTVYRWCIYDDQPHFCKSINFVLTNIKCGSSAIGLWWLLSWRNVKHGIKLIKSLNQSATNWLTLASKYLNPTLPSLAPGGGNLGQFPWSVEVMTPCWLLAEYRKCSRAHSALASSNPKLSKILQTFAKGFIHSFRTPKNGLLLSIHEFWSEKFLEGANDYPVRGSCSNCYARI